MDNPEIEGSLAQIKIPVLDIIILRDEDRYVVRCPELDLVTEMDSPEDALDAMLEMIKEYCNDYLKRESLFRKSPNRSHHYPYIIPIAQCKSDWELRELVEVRYGSVYV